MTKDFITRVGAGEIYVTGDPAVVLGCYGLGSCIGVSAFDPVARVGAMAHIVLPENNNRIDSTSSAKFADSGIPAMLEMMEKSGAKPYRVITKIAGGAKMIKAVTKGNILDIGERNIDAVMEAFARLGLKIHAQDIRGEVGRCLWLSIATGRTQVKCAQMIVDL